MNRCSKIVAILGVGWALSVSAAEAQTDAGVDSVTDTGGSEDVQLELTVESDLALGEVVVTAEIEEGEPLSAPSQTVDERELTTFERDDIHQVLARAPGVTMRQEDGFGLRPNIGIRGTSSERSSKITLMEDGILVAPAPYSAPAAYYFPMVTRLTGVEVFKGAASLAHGPQLVGGALNLVSRDTPDVGETVGAVDMAGGTDLYGKVHSYYGRTWEQFGFLVEGVHLQTSGFKDLDGGGDTGFDRQEVVARLRANTSLDSSVLHRFGVKIGFAHERSNETYLGLSDGDFQESPNRRYAASQRDRMTWWRAQAAIEHVLEVSDLWHLTTTLYRNDFSREWRKLNRFTGEDDLRDVLLNPGSGRRAVFYDVLTGEADSSGTEETLMLGTNDRRFVSEGIQSKGRLRFGGRVWGHEVELGVRLHHDEVRRRHTEDGFLMQEGRLVTDGGETVLATHERGRTTALAAYLLYALRFRRLTLEPGFRTESVHTDLRDLETDLRVTRSEVVFLPGFAARYEVLDDWEVFAGVHRGFSPVAPGQAKDVQSEESINYEAGTRLRDEETSLEATGFFTDYKNLLSVCTFSAGCGDPMVDRQFNGGAVHVFGVEALAAHAWRVGERWQLPTRVTYAWTHSEFQTTFRSDDPQLGSVEKGDELPYLPAHQLSAEIGIEEPRRWGMHVSGVYQHRMREEAGSGPAPQGFTVAFFTVDAAASYTFLRRATLYATVQNALNTQAIASRRPFGARPIRPLALMVGFKWSFDSDLPE